MNEVSETPSAEEIAKEKGAVKMAQIIYFLYLATLVIQIAHFVGVVMAYMNRYENAEWIETHFQYQIRTFWMFTLYLVIGGLSLVAGIGFVIIFGAAIWLIIRCAKGLKFLTREQPVPNPTTWLW